MCSTAGGLRQKQPKSPVCKCHIFDFFKLFLFCTTNFYVLPPTRNDRPFCNNVVVWGPMKLVSGSNKSLGTYRFDKISTVALGQGLQIEKLICCQ